MGGSGSLRRLKDLADPRGMGCQLETGRELSATWHRVNAQENDKERERTPFQRMVGKGGSQLE